MPRAVVTSFDENYFEYSMVLARSLADNYNGGERLEYICLVPLDLAARQEEYIQRVNRRDKLDIVFRSSTSYERLVASGQYNFDLLDHVSSNAMQRIFLASTLNEYDEVIYLDPDILILRDVDPLLNYKLHNKFAAAQEPDAMNIESFDDPDRPYFNNGVFITSLEYWRAARIEDQMVNFLTRPSYVETACIEQDLMNRFLFDVWCPLPFSFNFRNIDTGTEPFRFCQPMVVHFSGPNKPWHEYESLLEYEELWKIKYAQLTEEEITHE